MRGSNVMLACAAEKRVPFAVRWRSKAVALVIFALALALCVLGGVVVGYAHAPTFDQRQQLSEKVRVADYIFRGIVADIQYGFSVRVSDEEPPLPHTFVTYRIREVLKGEKSVESVTLRFMGGPDGEGGYLTVTDTPFFEEGDEDILLVLGNGHFVCPLVTCNGGRYRILDGEVFSNDGRPLLVTEAGQIVEGAGLPIADMREVKLPPSVPLPLRERRSETIEWLLMEIPEALREEVRTTWEQEARESPSLRQFTTQEAVDEVETQRRGERLSVETLTELIVREVRRQGDDEGRINSVDPSRPFRVDPPRPAEPLAAVSPPVMTDQERRELEIFEQQRGDPVIRQQ